MSKGKPIPRCSTCGWHYQARGHNPDCPEFRPPQDISRPPRRAFELQIRISADDWARAMDELEFLTGELQARGPDCESIAGGASSGHIVEVEENNISPEEFQERLKAWSLERRKERDANRNSKVSP